MRARTKSKQIVCFYYVLVLIVAGLNWQSVHAQDNPFAGGWKLDNAASSLTFQTIKNSSKLETSSFARFQGEVDEQGLGTVRIHMDSVDTKVDLRNVRMRFLLFETFKFPEAVVSVKVNPALIAELDARGRLELPLDFDLELHGVKRTLSVNTVVTVLAGDQVSVASVEPLPIETALFGMGDGVKKLERAAKVSIVPMGSVSFNFVFDRQPKQVAPEIAVAEAIPVALETQGAFSFEECLGRFEVLSETGAVHFNVSSAQLNPESKHVLATVIDVIQRCPRINVLVAGHTDSVGAEHHNQILSELRAHSVREYLINHAIDPQRIRAVGYGESRPVANNDTAWNRQLNRRIEFAVDDA